MNLAMYLFIGCGLGAALFYGQRLFPSQLKAEAECRRLIKLVGFRGELDGLPPLLANDKDFLLLLARTRHDSEWWVQMHRFLAAQYKVELQAALAPGVNDEERHYRAGRAAAIGDAADMLLQKWQRVSGDLGGSK